MIMLLSIDAMVKGLGAASQEMAAGEVLMYSVYGAASRTEGRLVTMNEMEGFYMALNRSCS